MKRHEEADTELGHREVHGTCYRTCVSLAEPNGLVVRYMTLAG